MHIHIHKLIKNCVKSLFISETKMDDCFLLGSFYASGGWGVELWSKFMVFTKYKYDDNIEKRFVEIHLWTKKWFLSCLYNPQASLIENHLNHISNCFDYQFSKYDNFTVMRKPTIKLCNNSDRRTTSRTESKNLHVLKTLIILFNIDKPVKMFSRLRNIWNGIIWFP